jgi:heptosyltransferase I
VRETHHHGVVRFTHPTRYMLRKNGYWGTGPVGTIMPRMESPRILIVRLSAIGDVIQSMPIACALRERFPNAFLAWAVEQPTGQLLQGHEALNEVIALPRGWLKSARGVLQLRQRLHNLRFDVAVEAQGLTKAAILAWLSGARRRIGFGRPWGRELSRWINTETVDTPGPHIVERNLQLLRPLGIDSQAVRFMVPEQPRDRQWADELVGSAGLKQGFAIINAGAGWPSKLWPAQRFGAVTQHLGAAWHLPTLVVWAGEEELAIAEQIVVASQGHAQCAPKTTLAELAALARRATMFIASDTGPLHLAAAVGTPCVGLYGPWPKEVHGPFGVGHIALQKAQFTGSTRQRRTAPPQLMEAISVADVCQACDEIMRRQSGSHRLADGQFRRVCGQST